MPPKPRFTVDVQTFTNAAIFLIAPAAIYFGFRGEKRTDEELEQEMAARQPSSMTQARKGNEALSVIFAARKEDGSFDAEMERKLDDLLHAGAKKRVRVNADNDTFHNRGGVAGIQRGVQFKSMVGDGGADGGNSGTGAKQQQEDEEEEDWRVGLTGAEIIKERKRRQRRRRKQKAKGDLSGEELLTQLMTLRAVEPQTEKVAKKKAKIKRALKQRGLSY
jgi:hypothetical protein